MTPSLPPVISMAALEGSTGGDGRDPARDALDEAAREWGCCLLVDHGIDVGVLEGVAAEALAFFRLPADEKDTIRAVGGLGYLRWPERGDEGGAGALLPSESHYSRIGATANVWPHRPAGLRGAVESAAQELDALAARLMRQAAALREGTEHTAAAEWEHTHSLTKLVYYPDIEPSHGHASVRAPAHSDQLSAVTILWPAIDPGGFELLDPDGAWMPLRIPDRSVFLNIGTWCEQWSGGDWRAVHHRVVRPGPHVVDAERLSIIHFFHPASTGSVVDGYLRQRGAFTTARRG